MAQTRAERVREIYEKTFTGPEAEARQEEFIRKAQEANKPFLDSVRDSERLTAQDFAVTVTPCPIKD